ncbi:hypothetical protein OROMI_024598 [Orobanche minor]
MVRDKAALYLNTFGDGSVAEIEKDFLFGSLDIPLSNMETSLKNYSSMRVELTEAETEYAVNVVNHIFEQHVCSIGSFHGNSLPTVIVGAWSAYILPSPDPALSGIYWVSVIVDASEAEEFSEVAIKYLRSLPYDTPAQTFVAFEKPEGVPAVGKFSNLLRFTVKEVFFFSQIVI